MTSITTVGPFIDRYANVTLESRDIKLENPASFTKNDSNSASKFIELMKNYQHVFRSIQPLSNQELEKQGEATCHWTFDNVQVYSFKIANESNRLLSLALFINEQLVNFDLLPTAPRVADGDRINGQPLMRFTVPTDDEMAAVQFSG
jgi:hypothetical protein